jgi:hypothetical protein
VGVWLGGSGVRVVEGETEGVGLSRGSRVKVGVAVCVPPDIQARKPPAPARDWIMGQASKDRKTRLQAKSTSKPKGVRRILHCALRRRDLMGRPSGSELLEKESIQFSNQQIGCKVIA